MALRVYVKEEVLSIQMKNQIFDAPELILLYYQGVSNSLSSAQVRSLAYLPKLPDWLSKTFFGDVYRDFGTCMS